MTGVAISCILKRSSVHRVFEKRVWPFFLVAFVRSSRNRGDSWEIFSCVFMAADQGFPSFFIFENDILFIVFCRLSLGWIHQVSINTVKIAWNKKFTLFFLISSNFVSFKLDFCWLTAKPRAFRFKFKLPAMEFIQKSLARTRRSPNAVPKQNHWHFSDIFRFIENNLLEFAQKLLGV